MESVKCLLQILLPVTSLYSFSCTVLTKVYLYLVSIICDIHLQCEAVHKYDIPAIFQVNFIGSYCHIETCSVLSVNMHVVK